MTKALSELLESNPNPSLEEEAAALDAAAADPVVETPAAPAIPEKFMKDGKPDYDALAKSYAELEAKLSGKKDDKTNEEAPAEDAAGDEDTPDEDKPAGEDEARDAVESAGLDFDALSAEFWESGKLADASYEALEAKGIPRAIVDGYIAGQQALLDATRTSVFNEVGGEQAYNDMLTWAADTMSETEIDAYNKAVNSGDMNQTVLAVKGLKARYQATEGFEPKAQISGGAPKGDAGFKSWAQVSKAMSDPRYKTDPAYVAEVEAKIAASGELL